MKSNYQSCQRCLMDETSGDFQDFQDGTCNYCRDFIKRKISFERMHQRELSKTDAVSNLVKNIKKAKNKSSEYDCIVGLSGGVDSCWVLAKAVEMGLKPLAVHMDNGWNSEIAQNNIANLVEDLGVDLYTYVINWTEYREMMNAFFKANVIDIELLYDNAAIGVLSRAARKFKVKFILSGMNLNSEGVAVPEKWKWNKIDLVNIKSIIKKESNLKIKTFPGAGLVRTLIDQYIFKIQTINLLNFVEYDLPKARIELKEKFGFKPYKYKHYESVFTRFYQGFILPNKFFVDKRKPHLSSLIMSGSMTREASLDILFNHSIYGDEFQKIVDTRYFLKKMKWSKNELLDYISAPEKSHSEYHSMNGAYQFLRGIYNKVQKK